MVLCLLGEWNFWHLLVSSFLTGSILTSSNAISSVALGAVQLAGAASICSLWSQDPPGPLQSWVFSSCLCLTFLPVHLSSLVSQAYLQSPASTCLSYAFSWSCEVLRVPPEGNWWPIYGHRPGNDGIPKNRVHSSYLAFIQSLSESSREDAALSPHHSLNSWYTHQHNSSFLQVHTWWAADYRQIHRQHMDLPNLHF